MIIFDFKEFGGNKDKSIVDCFQKEPYAEKQAVLNYLKTAGKEKCTCGLVKDIVTGEVHGTSLLYKDDKFSWITDIIYYIEKYNFRPDEKFIEHVLKQTKY
jgi:hypothetical protein